ncbi:hypothetical protein Kfla_4694 [Kribbella flavida DSM 17836]|uniref:Uncharacterized protein n=1 Tax=Kribbella flavida (strain DSM 17836 / JCM 10339 / NBRC 14399) TaxID=479435 RepID=D2PZA2_KRIFD|nr:hypothetical protein [Kribbella flavida]ADB33711.1 hypothetical protein Kfla_4694 [Kribbella flavida DSM 17836]
MHDDQADGYSARASIQLYQSSVGSWYDAHECFDDTTTANYQGWTFCNFSVADGTLVRIRMGRSPTASTRTRSGSFTT